MNIVARLNAKALVSCWAEGDIAWEHKDAHLVPTEVMKECDILLRERGLMLVHEQDCVRVCNAATLGTVH